MARSGIDIEFATAKQGLSEVTGHTEDALHKLLKTPAEFGERLRGIIHRPGTGLSHAAP
jgi:hypothetical protein